MLESIVARAAALLLPARCLVCGEPGRGIDLCAVCHNDLPRNDVACRRCALPLPLDADECGLCQRRPPAFTRAAAPLLYAAPIDGLLTRFKFHHDLAGGRLLAGLLCEAVAGWPGLEGIDRIVPLPLHPSRLAQRGYNQALELARPLARRLALPLDPEALRRERATAAQTALDAQARRRNVRGAFAAHERLRGARVLLLDDVITTGATMREAASAVLRAGAASVHVCAVARAP